MKRFFAFIVVLVALTACEDSEGINYNGTYVSASFKTSSARMFTKNGEIKKSQSFIEDSLPEHIATDIFYFSSAQDVNGEFVVEFLEDNQVNLIRDGDTEPRARINKSGIVYLEADEAGTVMVETNPVFPFGKLGKYKPLQTDTALVSTASGFKYLIEFKDCVYLEPEGSELRIPVFSYYLYRNYGISISGYAARQNNAFNKDILNNLAATDTLVVQQGYIVLREQ